MKIKKYFIWTICGLILFLLARVVYIFYGIKLNTGYTNGKVIKVVKEGRSQFPYTYFTYTVESVNYNGKCGGNYSIGQDCLVVYATERPKNSMVADYPYPVLDSLGHFNKIDTSAVEFDVANYSGN